MPPTLQYTAEDDGAMSDIEFDNLLATVPLPTLSSCPTTSIPTRIEKRKTGDDSIDPYEATGFGEIGKFMRNKRAKLKAQESALLELEDELSSRPRLFSGFVIHVNGYTSPPLSEIRSMIVIHGGTYMAYLDHKSVITHIIATSLTPKKRHEFRAYKIVTPEWIVQSVAAGRLLNWSDYALSNSYSTLAKGEVTGGQAIKQKTIFDLATQTGTSHLSRTKDLKSPMSTHSPSQQSSTGSSSRLTSMTFKATKPLNHNLSKHGSVIKKDISRHTDSGRSRLIPNHSKRSTFKKTSPLHVLTSTPLFIPPASQIDLSVLHELPSPLRLSILNSISSSDRVAIDPVTPIHASTSITRARTTPLNTSHNTGQEVLPSASQVDWRVLAQLPSSVRKPIENFYARKRREALAAASLPPQPNFTKKPDLDRAVKPDRISIVDKRSLRKKPKLITHRVAKIGPSQRLISKKSFKLITRDYDHPIEKHEEEREILPTPTRISDEQLDALEIDVRFFRELRGARAFQLDLIYDQFQLHGQKFKAVTMKSDRWRKWRDNFGKPSKVLTIEIPPPPKISSRSEPGGMSRLEDVNELIEAWIESYEDDVEDQIDEADVFRIEKFLIDSVDKSRGSGQDLEKVFKIIIWWEEVIKAQASVGQARWKMILDRIKEKLNEICERDHGACIF